MKMSQSTLFCCHSIGAWSHRKGPRAVLGMHLFNALKRGRHPMGAS